ncbi:hypothetical protein M3U23_17680 [Xanthomonas sp. PPL129]|uniref:hypothetical protein n=1 Tax=Xanthomonas sp. PPL121 TaxID=2942336 RepID=UPI0033B75643
MDQERNNNNSKNDGNSKSDGYGCGYSRFGFGFIAGRAVSVVVRGLAGLSLAAGRSRCAIGAGRSFVMSAGVSG